MFAALVGRRIGPVLASPTVRLFAAFLTAVATIHLAIYLSYANAPPNHVGGGWEGWWDQSQYIASARALAAGDFLAAHHWYPLGYPLLGAPFAYLQLRDPFLVPNLILTLVYAAAFLQFFRIYIGSAVSVAVFFVTMLFPGSIHIPYEVKHIVWLQFVIPWNTVPIAAIFMVALLLVRSLSNRPTLSLDLIFGGLTAFVVATRPVDIIALTPAWVAYFFQRLKGGRWQNLVAAGGAASCVAVAMIALMLIIYGGLSTPYTQNIAGIGMSPHFLLERTFAIFVDAGRSWGQTQTPLFALFPWMLIAVPFAIYGLARRPRDLLLPWAMMLASILTYLSFNDFSPVNVLQFFLLHYIAWAVPVIGAMGCVGIKYFCRERTRGHAAALTAVTLATIFLGSLRASPTPVWSRLELTEPGNGSQRAQLMFEGRQRVNAIDIPGTNANPEALQGNPYQIHADEKPLFALSDYRELRLEDRTRIIFNRPVDANVLSLVLDPTKTATIGAGDRIRAVEFKMRLDWPWVRTRRL